MTNINYTQFAITDAEFVLRLIKNGEWERAFDRAGLLMDSIKGSMGELGIEPSAIHIHDTTPVA